MSNPGFEKRAPLQVVDEGFIPTPNGVVIPTEPILGELSGMQETRVGITKYGADMATFLGRMEGHYADFMNEFAIKVSEAEAADEELRIFINGLEPNFNIRLDVLTAETQEFHADHLEVRAGKAATDKQRHSDLDLREEAEEIVAAQELVTAETQQQKETAEAALEAEKVEKSAAYNAKLEATRFDIQSMSELEDRYARRYDGGPEPVSETTLVQTAAAQAAHQEQVDALGAVRQQLAAARQRFSDTSEQNVRFEQSDRVHFRKGPERAQNVSNLAADYKELQAELDRLAAAVKTAHEAVANCTLDSFMEARRQQPATDSTEPAALALNRPMLFGEWQQADDPKVETPRSAAPRHAAPDAQPLQTTFADAETSTDDEPEPRRFVRARGQAG